MVVSHVTGFTTTWIALLALLALHLSLNYAAVRAVQMTSLNRQRANIVLSSLFESDAELHLSLETQSSPNTAKSLFVEINPQSKTPQASRCIYRILTPAQVASQERIFHRDGALQWTYLRPESESWSSTYLGSAEIGISLDSFFKRTHLYNRTRPNSVGSPSFQTAIPMTQLTTLFAEESYILFIFPLSEFTTSKWHASILLKKGCTVTAQLKAWAHALLAARVLSSSPLSTTSSSDSEKKSSGKIGLDKTSLDVFDAVARVLGALNREDRFGGYVDALQAGGWDVDVGALETRGGRRVTLE